MEKTIAHLGFIQGVISRMGANSFLLKGWSVTLVAAIFALSAKDANFKFVLIAYFPVIVFWVLDSYFLHQERLFRKLYEGVASGRISSEKFTMDTTIVRNDVASICCAAFSKTLLIFHGAVIAIVLFAMFFIMKP
ncbi:hypothetical protein [Chromobacterium sp. IIBBL 290-4]|uniref:hypothetical protein n=1 Tax=Chromobacterium sp. IIBBL 290-4 TaxID=2953890 RepID=UPI0020B84080|nr:hypothetical protein [Chromobacterium sp. IIBBL 290-4]UTH74220.1 hypothetical protein NKT35_22215 [Chromobacterium sp. IIBBL 290-4]